MGQQPTKRMVRSLARAVVDRYRPLPSWVLFPQLFLAFGWLRAGLANAIDPRWWSGDGVVQFLATEAGRRVGLYHYVLEGVVVPRPGSIAAVVCVAQIAVGLLLATNTRPMVGLAVGAFLNLNFILAGAVNPSVFYLVATLGIVVWRLETTAWPATSRRTATVASFVALGLAVSIGSSVETLDPRAVVEDPALVLIFVATLTAAVLWWVHHRVVAAVGPIEALATERDSSPSTPDRAGRGDGGDAGQRMRR